MSRKKQAVDNAINRVLLEETVKKLDVKVDKKTVDERVDTTQEFVSDRGVQVRPQPRRA